MKHQMTVSDLFEVRDTTKCYPYQERDNLRNRIFSVLCYLSVLVVIPLLFNRGKSKYVRFHIEQGGKICIISTLGILLLKALSGICTNEIAYIILFITDYIFLFSVIVFELIGLIGALSGKAVTLPLIDKIIYLG